MENDSIQDMPVLPVVRQPRGASYFLGTWSGRILLLNTVIFVLMVLREPAAVFVPSIEFVREFGSKSIPDIARGEYWRFVTPMFVHIGFIHFFFNALGLYYIGYQIERILGPRWFVGVFLVTGIIGNLSSCLFSLSVSAGASGALFGLLGAGFRLEGLVSDQFDRLGERNRPRKRIYSGMVVSNIILGLIIPVIDNAAHIGGLVSGWLLMEALLRSRPNRLRPINPLIARLIYLILTVFSVVAVARTADPVVVVKRYYEAALGAGSAPEAYHDFSEALRVSPLDGQIRLSRGKLLLQNGEVEAGIADIKIAVSSGKVSESEFKAVMEDLRLTGHSLEAELIQKLYQSGGGAEI
jgi:membrane associated rhomboid family serine protease